MTFDPIQRIDVTSKQAFRLTNASDPTTGSLLERDGTGTVYINAAVPEAKNYADDNGTTRIIGAIGYSRFARDSNDTTINRNRERFVKPILKWSGFLANKKSTEIKIGDRVAGAIGGIQKATSGMYAFGVALSDMPQDVSGYFEGDVISQSLVA